MSKVASSPIGGNRLAEPGRLFLAALIGLLLALVSNAAIFYAGKALGASFVVSTPIDPEWQITIVAVVALSVVAVIGATMVLIGLDRILKQPYTGFMVVSLIVLLLSLFVVFRQTGAGTIIGLALMHLTSAMFIIWALWRFGRA